MKTARYKVVARNLKTGEKNVLCYLKNRKENARYINAFTTTDIKVYIYDTLKSVLLHTSDASITTGSVKT